MKPFIMCYFVCSTSVPCRLNGSSIIIHSFQIKMKTREPESLDLRYMADPALGHLMTIPAFSKS